MKSLTDYKVGDVLSFHYQGENKPARNRLARIVYVDNVGGYVKCEDLEINEPRNFSNSRASKIDHIANAEQDVFVKNQLSKEIFGGKGYYDKVDGYTVAELYKNLNPDQVLSAVYFFKQDAIVVSKRSSEPTLEVEVNDTGYILSFTNTNSEELCLAYDEQAGSELFKVDKNRNISDKINNPKISDILRELNKHYS